MEVACPRCTKTFDCKADDVTRCDCVHIQVHPETREFLESTSYGCLCAECLVALNAMVVMARETPLPPPGQLREGLHYYMDNGLMVFTEFYHIQRGYCCRNECRHCAYGTFRKREST